MFSTVLTLAGKDWRLFWSDRRAALLCFLIPIILASAFGMIFDRPDPASDMPKLQLLVAVENETPAYRLLIDDLEQSDRVDIELIPIQDIEERLRERRGGVAVILPEQFDSKVGRPRLAIRYHPLAQLEAQWAEGVMTELIMKRIARESFGPVVGAWINEKPLEVTSEIVAGPRAQFNSYSHSFCGMTLQYLFFWGMESGLMLLRERRQSAWQRLRSAPVSLMAILLGKVLSTATIALLQVMVVFFFGYLVFGITIDGSLWAFIGIALAISLLSASTGLLVAALGGSEARARSISILAILTVSMLGGLWLPSFLLPEWLQKLSHAFPTSWAMKALDGATWQGRSFLESVPHLLVVLSFASVFMIVAFRFFYRSERIQRRGRHD